MPKCYIHIIHLVIQAPSQVMPKLLPDTLPPCSKTLINVYCLQYIYYVINNTFICIHCIHYIIMVYKQATSKYLFDNSPPIHKVTHQASSFRSDPCIRNMDTHSTTENDPNPRTWNSKYHGFKRTETFSEGTSEKVLVFLGVYML